MDESSQARSKYFFRLEPSERSIYEVSGRIMAAFISSGVVDDTNREKFMDQSFDIAVFLAEKAERLVTSDDER